MSKMPSCLVYIGHEAVFFIPRRKLRLKIGGKLAKHVIHDFLSACYKGYTVADSTITGFWLEGEKSQIFKDKSVEYRVAFDGRARVADFVNFLSVLCGDIDEKAIYLKMGKKSWLVYPGGSPLKRISAAVS